jgi:hypothetical protein
MWQHPAMGTSDLCPPREAETAIRNLGKRFERELEEFFVNYHRLSGKQYRILALKGPAGGRRCVKQAQKRAR